MYKLKKLIEIKKMFKQSLEEVQEQINNCKEVTSKLELHHLYDRVEFYGIKNCIEVLKDMIESYSDNAERIYEINEIIYKMNQYIDILMNQLSNARVYDIRSFYNVVIQLNEFREWSCELEEQLCIVNMLYQALDKDDELFGLVGLDVETSFECFIEFECNKREVSKDIIEIYITHILTPFGLDIENEKILYNEFLKHI